MLIIVAAKMIDCSIGHSTFTWKALCCAKEPNKSLIESLIYFQYLGSFFTSIIIFDFAFFSILGNLPNASEGIVERTACFLGNLAGNYCVHHLQIRVKDCGSYRVYYLYPTPSNDEAYCFGKQCTCIVYATKYLN